MKKLSKGFTLIELMIVVAIIGILAAIAIPNFMKYQLRSKFSEASSNIEGLRKAEEALRQGERRITVLGTIETTYAAGTYWDMKGGIMPLTNGATPGTAKIVWTPAELGIANAMDWTVEGATYFQYQATVAGCPTTDATMVESGICYGVGARSNIDGDTVNGEAALMKPFQNPATNALTQPTMTSLGVLKIAWPGSIGTCIDNSSNPVYAMPCTLSGPDVF
jgi:type IV pilus assembly protein PilA